MKTNRLKQAKHTKQYKQPKQLSFIKPQQKFFGGVLLVGRRKTLRPLTSKDSIHFVLRSTWAKGPDSFLARRNRHVIERILLKFAKKFGVRIYRQAITSNHLHLLLRITNRTLYRAFIRAVSGKIASHIMGQQSFKIFAKARVKLHTGDGSQIRNMMSNSKASNRDLSRDRSNDQSNNQRKVEDEITSSVWQYRPFSRVVNWGQDFKSCAKYLLRNNLEAFGFIPYKPQKLLC